MKIDQYSLIEQSVETATEHSSVIEQSFLSETL